jgi:hypothetical protein
MDAVLKREPADDAAALMARLNRRLPGGLRLRRWEPMPTYAAPVAELARLAHWRWPVPGAWRDSVERGVAAFLATETWPWERGSKTGPAPDLRALLSAFHWEGDALCFTTSLGAFRAANPLKVLGAILGRDPGTLQGLVRTALETEPDQRLTQGERFQPKLKNMYEDAVLLGAGSNITLVDEDDDEPLHLGPA